LDEDRKMSEDDNSQSEKMKNKDLVWLLKEDRTPSNSSVSASKNSGKTTPDQHRNWKVLERGKSEVQNPKSDLEVKKDMDPKLKRSTSFPEKPGISTSSTDKLELCYPVHEGEEMEFSPVLYRSKSSLWSVSTESSAVTAQQRSDNQQSEVIPSDSKINATIPARDDLGRSLQSPIGTVDRRSNKDLSLISSPQPPKPQRSFQKMQTNDSVTSQPKRTKGMTISVQDFKSKNDRDPEFTNEELKVT